MPENATFFNEKFIKRKVSEGHVFKSGRREVSFFRIAGNIKSASPPLFGGRRRRATFLIRKKRSLRDAESDSV